MTEFLQAFAAFFKQFWPGLAVMFFNYEESKIDRAVKEKEAAELAAKNLQDEKTIRDSYRDKSDSDVVASILESVAANPNPGEPTKPPADG